MLFRTFLLVNNLQFLWYFSNPSNLQKKCAAFDKKKKKIKKGLSNDEVKIQENNHFENFQCQNGGLNSQNPLFKVNL